MTAFKVAKETYYLTTDEDQRVNKEQSDFAKAWKVEWQSFAIAESQCNKIKIIILNLIISVGDVIIIIMIRNSVCAAIIGTSIICLHCNHCHPQYRSR